MADDCIWIWRQLILIWPPWCSFADFFTTAYKYNSRVVNECGKTDLTIESSKSFKATNLDREKEKMPCCAMELHTFRRLAMNSHQRGRGAARKTHGLPLNLVGVEYLARYYPWLGRNISLARMRREDEEIVGQDPAKKSSNRDPGEKEQQ